MAKTVTIGCSVLLALKMTACDRKKGVIYSRLTESDKEVIITATRNFMNIHNSSCTPMELLLFTVVTNQRSVRSTPPISQAQSIKSFE